MVWHVPFVVYVKICTQLASYQVGGVKHRGSLHVGGEGETFGTELMGELTLAVSLHTLEIQLLLSGTVQNHIQVSIYKV